MKNIQNEIGFIINDIAENRKNNTIIINDSYFESRLKKK